MSTLQKIHWVSTWNIVGSPSQTEIKPYIKTNTSTIKRYPKNSVVTGWSKLLPFSREMEIVANKNVRIWQDLANCWDIKSCFVSYKAFQEMWQILKKGGKACTAHRNLLPFHGPAKRKEIWKKKYTRDLPVPDLPFHLISTLHKMLKKNYRNKEYAYYYKQWLVQKAKALNFCPGDREAIDIRIKCPNPKSHTLKRIRIPLVVLSIMYNFPS